MLAKARRAVAYQRIAGGVARPRRVRYSASGGDVLTPADFRTLAPAEALSWLNAQGFAHARGTTAWFDTVAGVWTEIGGSLPLVTDRGLKVPGALTQYIPNTEMAGAVVGVLGSGGALPTGWSLISTGQPSIVAVELSVLADGRASIQLRGESTANGAGGFRFHESFSVPQGKYWVRCRAGGKKISGGIFFAQVMSLSSGTGSATVIIPEAELSFASERSASSTHLQTYGNWMDDDIGEISISGLQLFNTLFNPGILVRGSGSSSIASAAEQIQREVTASASFYGAIEVIAASGVGAAGTAQWAWQRANEAGTAWVGIYKAANDGKLYYSVNDGTTETKADLGTLAADAGVALAFNATDGTHTYSKNGAAVATLSAPMPAGLTVETIGNNSAFDAAWWGIIERLGTTSGEATDTWLQAQGTQT